MFTVGLIEKNAGLLLAWRFLLLIGLFLGCIILPAHGFERYTAHGGPVRGLALSPDGKMLVTASFDYSAVVWKAKALGSIRPYWVTRLLLIRRNFRPMAKLATAGDDGVILL